MSDIKEFRSIPQIPEEKDHLNREEAGKIRRWLDLADEVLATDEEEFNRAA